MSSCGRRSPQPPAILLAFLLLALPARAATEVPLTTLLDQVGRQVENFWNYFPAVTCTEMQTQSKLDGKGKVLFEQRTSYDYLILLQNAGGGISVEESRIEKGRPARKGKASLLLTSGFALMTLIFHPLYQSSYEFQQLPDDTSDGALLLRIAFRHLHSNRSPSVLLLREREYPLEWKGTAWIDPHFHAVVRIQAGLAGSMEDIGLLQLDTSVSYSNIPFAGTKAVYWLPTRAVIEAATKRQHWRNTDVFTGYRRFDVETEIRTANPQ